MAQFLKFKVLFAVRLYLNGGQFCTEISNFGYFDNLQIILKRVKNYKTCKSSTFAMES